MALARNQMIVLGLVVVVAVVVIIAAAFVIKNYNKDDSNPNGILGMYEVVEYTQYGSSDSTSSDWKWYKTGDGMYDGEKIRIDSYKNGVITATCILGDDRFEIIGYYNPDDGSFGYASYYDYVPGNSQNVIDVLHGAIIGNTMYLRGYTISADDSSNVMYTFNFVFVKQGQKAKMVDFKQVLFEDKYFTCKESYKTYVENGYPALEEKHGFYNYNITSDKEFLNGVYSIKVDDESGTTKFRGSATTVFQDEERTYLRCVVSDIADGNLYLSWICVEGDQMYVLETGKDDEKGCMCNYEYILTSGKEVKKYETYDLSGKLMMAKIHSYNSHGAKDVEQVLHFTKKLGDSFTTPALGTVSWLLVSVWPEVNYISFIDVYTSSGAYGDVLGYINQKGEIVVTGFYFTPEGEVTVTFGTLKQA